MNHLTTTEQELLDQVANTFMTMRVSVGTWRGVIMNRDAAERAAINDGVSADANARLYIDALGSHTSHLKAVIQKFTRVRTYVYDVTTSTASGADGRQRRGDLMLPTATVPDVLAKLQKLKREATDALDAFLVHYDQYALRAKAEVGPWLTKSLPSADEVRRAFYIDVSAPKPLNVVNPEQLKRANIPADMAAKLSAQSVSEARAQLEAAKDNILEAATEHLDRVAKQLTDGKRLHDSLLEHAKVHAVFITDMAKALGDPRLEAIGTEFNTSVLNVRNMDQWRDPYSPRRREAAKAAAKVSRDIKTLASQPRQSLPQAQPEGEVMLPDLFD
jgi:hypothetical protein